MRRALIADAQNREDAMRAELTEKERELQLANTTISDLREENATLESNGTTLSDRVHYLEVEVDERDDVARQWKEWAEALEQENIASRQENERLRDEVDELGNQLEECREKLRDEEEAGQSLEADLDNANDEYQHLAEEHEATKEELDNTRERMEVLEEREGRLLTRVYAQELQDIGIPAAHTVYIQDPDLVVAHVTKANAINGFDLFMGGRKRTNRTVQELSARAAAEYANTMNIKPECRGEMLDKFFSRGMDTFCKRAVSGVKRRRMEERLTLAEQ